MDIEFTKDGPGDNPETLDVDKSPHGALRRAIACCETGDHITLSLEAAMGLIMEWDKKG